MPRITTTIPLPGDIADSTVEDANFAAFTTTTLNEYNVRDAGLDLPQFDSNIILKYKGGALIGTDAWNHTLIRSITSHNTTGAATKHQLQDSGGSDTFLDLSSTPWSMESGDLLRVYFNLSVRPKYTGSPWASSAAIVEFDEIGAGTTAVDISLAGHCWLASLEWDITSAALSNWVPVSGQTSYSSTVGSYTGGTLEGSRAAFPIPAWRQAVRTASEGEVNIGTPYTTYPMQWDAVHGSYFYLPTGNQTIYGIRVVLHGLYHPAQSSSTNYLIVDQAIGGSAATLEYSSGQLRAMLMRRD